MKYQYVSIVALFLQLITFQSQGQNKILFDASKAQAAGNADWVIDADLHNINFSSGPAIVGSGTESNAQRFPSPLQSTITASTTEDYWQGALSYWAIDCVKKGYTVETLPYNGTITYGNPSNPQDLSNYKAFIIDEPNIAFTTAEANAIVNFVANGGGLFMISDHDVSDRNNDGIDSPTIFNNLMSGNTIQANPFGITFDLVSFSQTSSNVANIPTDPILHGSTGDVTQVKWSAGTSMTLNTTQNSNIKGVVFKTGASTTGLTNVLCAYTTYGNGKVAAIGDSSVPDDGTGDTNDTLYDGYITDAAGNHQRLLMNITNWLMTSNLATNSYDFEKINLVVAPNPVTNKQINVSYYTENIEKVTISILDYLGRAVSEVNIDTPIYGKNYKKIDIADLPSGMYLCKITTSNASQTLKIIVE